GRSQGGTGVRGAAAGTCPGPGRARAGRRRGSQGRRAWHTELAGRRRRILPPLSLPWGQGATAGGVMWGYITGGGAGRSRVLGGGFVIVMVVGYVWRKKPPEGPPGGPGAGG